MEKRCYGCMRVKTQSPLCEHCGYNENIDNLPHQLPLGTVLQNRYEIGKVLGQGGFGITYLGWDWKMSRAVAIKEYYPNNLVTRECSISTLVNTSSASSEGQFQANRERFLREAMTLSELDEIPGIVRVYSQFEENNTAYFAMEYIQGMDLRRYIQLMGGRLGAKQTMKILRPVMEALEKVHEAELVHRDISPDNIMLLPDGSTKLLDFGAAKQVADAEAGKEMSQSTESILKHGFAPMEQYQKKGSLGPWTDVYALCATIYYCLTGQVPPDAPARLLEGLELGWKDIPGLTQEQAEALEKGMRIVPKERTHSVAELAEILCGPEPEPVEITVAGSERKSKKGLLIAAVLVILVAAGGMALVKDLGAENAGEQKVSASQSAAQAEAVLMQDPLSVFTEIQKTEILTATFLNTTKDAPRNSQDVSAEKNGSVRVWLTKNGAGYDLYFGAEGKVQAGSSCAGMFSGCSNLKQVNFNDCFDTSRTTDMGSMFASCLSLEKIDLSGLDTSKVTNMNSMFAQCASLTTFRAGSFDTSNVTNLGSMFKGCTFLSKLDLSGFETSKVVDMSYMFYGCNAIKNISWKSLDVTNVKNGKCVMNEGARINNRPWKELFQ